MPSHDSKRPSPQEQEALRQEIAEEILETAGLLEKALADALPSATFKHKLSVELHEREEERIQAEAAIVQELIDIVLPELERAARPISEDSVSKGEKEQGARIEALLGSMSARHRQAEWLNARGMRVAGGIRPASMLDYQPNDSGANTGRTLYLLVDGRLVEVDRLGTWSLQGHKPTQFSYVIASTEVLTASEALRYYGLMDIIGSLHSLLYYEPRSFKVQHVEDLPERRARFEAIASECVKLAAQHTAQLRRVGDNPA